MFERVLVGAVVRQAPCAVAARAGTRAGTPATELRRFAEDLDLLVLGATHRGTTAVAR